MLAIEIPDFGTLRLENVVLDYNGTLAVDGRLLDGVAERLKDLAGQVALHVVTGDTFGKARQALDGLPCQLTILAATEQSSAKYEYIRALGVSTTACIGNGRNDRLMMKSSALAIAVIQAEGGCAETIAAAHVIVTDIRDALDLLLEPQRLTATLRG